MPLVQPGKIVSSSNQDTPHLAAARTDGVSLSTQRDCFFKVSNQTRRVQKHIYLLCLALKQHGIHLEIKFAHQIKEWRNIMDGSGLSGGETAPVNKREWEES